MIKFWITIGLACSVALSGCTSSEKKIEDSANGLNKKDKVKLEELKAEIEVGRNMAGRMLQHFGVVQNSSLVSYVNRIGRYVANYSDVPDRKYMFQVLNTEMVNAFACPGGYILITKGTLRLLESEAELAMILGHEVAHVSRRHMFETLNDMDQDELSRTAKIVENNKNFPDTIKVRKRPEPDTSKAGSTLARYVGGATGLNILQVAKAGMTVMLEKGLSKEMEYEADKLGAQFAVSAGYHVPAMIDFFKRLMERQKKINMKTMDKTHPSLDSRINQVEGVLAQLQASEIVGAKGAQRYLSIRSKLPKKVKTKK